MSNMQFSLFQSKFDRRFLEDYVGKSILTNPRIAVIELVANAWDAYASKVQITWPNDDNREFSIEDNGCGLTEEEFNSRWMTLSYNRIAAQGKWAEIPSRLKRQQGDTGKRRVFGRYGKGRHSGFCFSSESYYVETTKNGKKLLFKVMIPTTGENPIVSQKVSETRADASKSGTKVYVNNTRDIRISEDEIRTEIGMRFLSDPNFHVWVNKREITFSDVPSDNFTELKLKLSNDDVINILKIDIKDSDRTTRQHGIAWQVHGRLVGNIDWHSLGESFLDKRKTAAKRFSFIVKADCLADYVESDWMSFNNRNPIVAEAFDIVSKSIKAIIFEASKDQRDEVFANIIKKNDVHIKNMGSQERVAWAQTVKKIQQDCPSLSDNDIQNVGNILAKMEASKSKFGLLNKLGACSSADIDNLNTILESWSVETAKIVLNELETRLKLIDELSCKVSTKETDEVQELQPLFKRGLWIFGPEFEAVGFTSNQGMTQVIREVFHNTVITGSRNRPDFVVTPDSSLGFYAHSSYDNETGGENGISRLVIIELKKPSVPLGVSEKDQCWKYVKELRGKGLIFASTRVNCFLLGRTIERHENESRNEGNVRIEPLTYDTILNRAKSRTHLLYEKIKDEAPFLQDDESTEIDAALAASPMLI